MIVEEEEVPVFVLGGTDAPTPSSVADTSAPSSVASDSDTSAPSSVAPDADTPAPTESGIVGSGACVRAGVGFGVAIGFAGVSMLC